MRRLPGGRRAPLLIKLLALAKFAGGLPPADTGQDLLEGLTADQRNYCESPARRRVVTGGRRSGKTEAVIADLVKTAWEGGECAYISLTRKLAKRTVWKRLKKRLRQLKTTFRANETTCTIEIDGGGIVELGGADDKEAIERYRGVSYALVVIDECGSHPNDLLVSLVGDVLRPALMDYEGRLTLSGTPGFVLGGFWYEQAAPDDVRPTEHPVWRWTIHDNPLFEGRVESELAAVLEENSWTVESISYRREYLGEWVQDEGVLVYPFDPVRNLVERLPSATPRGYPVNGKQWSNVISVDIGTTKQSLAIVVWAAHPALRDEYMVHAEAHDGMLIDTLEERLRELLRRFPRTTAIVVDDGGMGAQHAMELAQRGLPIVSAKKREKPSAVRVMRDRILAGRVKLLNLASLLGVRKEWRRLGWDDDHLSHNKAQPDHYSDSALYGLRELRNHWTDEDTARPSPAPGSEEEMEELDERMALEYEERRRSGEGWESILGSPR